MKFSMMSLIFGVVIAFGIHSSELLGSFGAGSGNATNLTAQVAVVVDGNTLQLGQALCRGGTINNGDKTGIVAIWPLPYEGPDSVMEFACEIRENVNGDLKWYYDKPNEGGGMTTVCVTTTVDGLIKRGDITETNGVDDAIVITSLY